MLRSPHPNPLPEGEGDDRTKARGRDMDDLSLKDRIAALEEHLNTFGRHL